MSLREFIKMTKFTQLGSHRAMTPTSLIPIVLQSPYVSQTMMTYPFISSQKWMMPKLLGNIWF